MRRKLVKEISICAFFILVLILLILFDVHNLSMPRFLFIKKTELVTSNLFSIQASIAVIGIAIVSIITGSLNDTIYGVSVVEFITSIQSPVFKSKYLIFANLILIVVNCWFVSWDLFYGSVGLFIITIIIDIVLVKNVFIVFSGKDEIREKILKHVSNCYHVSDCYGKTIIEKLTKETLDAVESGNSLIIRRNYEAYKSILDDDNIKEVIVRDILEGVSNVFGAIVKTYDSNKINDCILFVCEIYDSVKGIDLKLWNKIKENYFCGIKFLSASQLIENKVHLTLRKKLFENIERSNFNKLGEIDIEYYSCRVYCGLFDNNFICDEREKIKRKLCKDVLSIHGDRNEKFYYIKERCYLLREMIKKGDCKTLSEYFFKEAQNNECDYIIEIIVITIYLYYLKKCENLLKDSPLKSNAEKIIKENKEIISDIILSGKIDFLKITNDYYKEIFSMMNTDTWEFDGECGYKWIVMDKVIEECYVFLVLNNFLEFFMTGNTNEIKEKIEDILQITSTGDASIYLRYFKCDKTDELTKKYESFSQLFNFPNNKTSVVNPIDVLKSIFENINQPQY